MGAHTNPTYAQNLGEKLRGLGYTVLHQYATVKNVQYVRTFVGCKDRDAADDTAAKLTEIADDLFVVEKTKKGVEGHYALKRIPASVHYSQQEIEKIIREETVKFNQEHGTDYSPDLMAGLGKAESDFSNTTHYKLKPNEKGELVVHHVNGKPIVTAYGIMGITPATAEFLGMDADRLGDPRYNARAGIKYYHLLHKRFKNAKLAIAGYNCGPERVKYGKIPLIEETQRHVKKVRKYYLAHGGTDSEFSAQG